MKISMLNFWGYVALAAAISFSAVSCIGSLDDIQVHDGSSVTIKAECLDMLPQFHDPLAPATRADNKTQEEKAVRTLHLFFFDEATGEFLEPKAGDQNFHPYQKLTTNVLTIKDEVFTQMSGVQDRKSTRLNSSHWS